MSHGGNRKVEHGNHTHALQYMSTPEPNFDMGIRVMNFIAKNETGNIKRIQNHKIVASLVVY